MSTWPARLAALALAAMLIADAFLLFGPVMRETSCEASSPTSSSGSEPECTSASKSLLEDNDDSLVFSLAAVPLAFTGTGLLWAIKPPRIKAFRWVVAGIFFGLCLLTGFSVGLLFMPAALLGLVAIALDDQITSRDRVPGP